MHSRIYQLDRRKIDKDDYCTEENYYENFVGIIADYVATSDDREADIEWLLSALSAYGVTYDEEESCIRFSKDFKVNYFENRYMELKKLMRELTFRKYIDGDIYGLSYFFEGDKFGFYIDIEDSVYTLDEFIRYNVEINEETSFYVGATIDYHA